MPRSTPRSPIPKLLVAAALMFAVCALPGRLRAQATVEYTLEREGRTSLAVYDKQGRQIRTLLSAATQPAGRHAAEWDGLDRDGRPLPPGEYDWRLISSPGVKAEYLLSIGTSVGPEHWPCQHGGPAAVAVSGDAFVMGGSSEGSPVLSKADFAGKVIWSRADFPAPESLVDVAADGDRVYALMSSGVLERLDGSTGASVKLSPKGPAASATA